MFVGKYIFARIYQLEHVQCMFSDVAIKTPLVYDFNQGQ